MLKSLLLICVHISTKKKINVFFFKFKELYLERYLDLELQSV